MYIYHENLQFLLHFIAHFITLGLAFFGFNHNTIQLKVSVFFLFFRSVINLLKCPAKTEHADENSTDYLRPPLWFRQVRNIQKIITKYSSMPLLLFALFASK